MTTKQVVKTYDTKGTCTYVYVKSPLFILIGNMKNGSYPMKGQITSILSIKDKNGETTKVICDQDR